jgi:hypothetical protein
MSILITPGGARVLRAMIVSCGTAGCFDSIKRLENVKVRVPLTAVGQDAEGNWQMAAFSRLKNFAVEEGITVLDTYDVIRYFGGSFHINIMVRLSGHAGLGQYLGSSVGLVSHVALPLEDGVYENAGHRLEFENYIVVNPSSEGHPFYHLGLVVHVPITQAQVKAIKAEQESSVEFVEALSKIKQPIVPPDEYWEALNCTVKKAATK